MMNNRSRFYISLILLVFSVVVAAGPIYSQEQSYPYQESDFDLTDPKTRSRFLNSFRVIPKVNICEKKADLAVGYMRERDSGIESKDHLWVLRKEYENEKLTLRQYVDEQRLVNDVHRTRTTRAGGGFRFTDPDEMWVHQFRFCFESSYHY